MGLKRISCSALCRITNDDGRYLLALNANRLRQGKQVFMALGGAITYADAALIKKFHATPENAERELRWFIEEDEIPRFRTWFMERKGRETDPFRELHEELVDEQQALPALDKHDVRWELVEIYEGDRITDRTEAIGQPTHYLIEIFHVWLTPNVMNNLLNADSRSGLRWVTLEEIRRGLTSDLFHVDAEILIPK